MKLWHITTASHNSHYSERMFKYHVHLGEYRRFTDKEELVITETVGEIVKSDRLSVVAFNICGDHIHILLVCEKEEVPKIVGKIKSMTARAANIAVGRTISSRTMGHAPLAMPEQSSSDESGRDVLEQSSSDESGRGKTQCHLWTQKYGKNEIRSNQQYLNTVNYIRNNRVKHKLSVRPELERIIESFVCTMRDAKLRYEC